MMTSTLDHRLLASTPAQTRGKAPSMNFLGRGKQKKSLKSPSQALPQLLELKVEAQSSELQDIVMEITSIFVKETEFIPTPQFPISVICPDNRMAHLCSQ